MSARYRSLVILIMLMLAILVASRKLSADSGTCGGATTTLPFTDVESSIFFCQIAEAYFSGLTNGTSPTTYSPTDQVTREQMAAFATRTHDSALRRGSRRAALGQWWTTTPHYDIGLGVTNVDAGSFNAVSDGKDIWVANFDSGTVSRVQASDGKLLDTWTGATLAYGIVAAMGRIFATGALNPGNVYMIDPTQPAGAVVAVTTPIPDRPLGIAFDGSRIWTANENASISIITPSATLPWPVTTVQTQLSSFTNLVYDGTNIWATSFGSNILVKLDTNGKIIQSAGPLGGQPLNPVFDGTNIWVPCQGPTDTLAVVRASTGAVVARLTGNGLSEPRTAAFDGERICVTNQNAPRISLWKASDLTPIGFFSTGVSINTFGVCSDGLNFWITVPTSPGKLMRF